MTPTTREYFNYGKVMIQQNSDPESYYKSQHTYENSKLLKIT